VIGYLLVGGQGRRMGGCKASRLFAGRPLWRYGYELLQQCCAQVHLLGHCPDLELPTRVEKSPGQGPLGALVDALESTPGDWNLVLALDYPLLTLDVVEQLRPGLGLARLPRCQGQPHPLCGCYHRQAAGPLGEAFRGGERSLLRALAGLGEQVHWLEFGDSGPFLNVNSPADLR
jgi:molybdopterin-guanine dinucleotide biosynthesis protein A